MDGNNEHSGKLEIANIIITRIVSIVIVSKYQEIFRDFPCSRAMHQSAVAVSNPCKCRLCSVLNGESHKSAIHEQSNQSSSITAVSEEVSTECSILARFLAPVPSPLSPSISSSLTLHSTSSLTTIAFASI